MRVHSPLVYERELAVNGAARDKLGGLDVHVSGGLVGAVREEAAHHHQAGEAGRFFVRGVGLRVQLAAQPAAHVSSAVEGTVSGRVYGHKHRKVLENVEILLYFYHFLV